MSSHIVTYNIPGGLWGDGRLTGTTSEEDFSEVRELSTFSEEKHMHHNMVNNNILNTLTYTTHQLKHEEVI